MSVTSWGYFKGMMSSFLHQQKQYTCESPAIHSSLKKGQGTVGINLRITETETETYSNQRKQNNKVKPCKHER